MYQKKGDMNVIMQERADNNNNTQMYICALHSDLYYQVSATMTHWTISQKQEDCSGRMLPSKLKWGLKMI